MSIRTKLLRALASATTACRFSNASSSSSSRPSPVSLTETFASRPSSSIRSRTRWYAERISVASLALATSSPSTSIVAIFPSAFRRFTTWTAWSSVGPAMYGAERRRTTRRGTAGSTRTIALSIRVTGRRASGLAHEALAGCAHERDGLGKEDAHRVAEGDRLLVGATGDRHLRQRRRGQLDGGVQRQRRELLAL